MLLIFVDEVSKRLNYTLKVMFEARGIEFSTTNDVLYFKNSEELKIVYSEIPFEEDYLTISPADLLFEEDIKPQSVGKANWCDEEVLSFNGKPDVLASIFFVLSMYDEYTSESEDKHGRFEVKESVLYRYEWLETLVVERWTLSFLKFIEEFYNTQIKCETIPFKIIPTFDIDNTYAYKLKSGWRRWLSQTKDYTLINKTRIKERKSVLKNTSKDPYDTFNYIIDISNRGFEVKVFWLLGDYALYDRNISHNNLEHQQLIKKMSDFVDVGLHPSYKSNEAPSQLNTEKLRLENILEKEVDFSRQHFLKVKLPSTYLQLIKEGFKDDYTLGFADHIGFRAGISRPFKWFNLKANLETTLTLHPFAYMDGTLCEYNNLTIDEAKNKVSILMKEIQKYGGGLISIWHNETIGDYGKWKGWASVLEHTLDSNSA
ncbi:MAG: polysaccharide deacetylase family protein [Brumimicrobium sp.]